MCRIVVDTNVYISAVLFGGKPKTLLERIVSGDFALFLSPPIIEELTWVLSRRKFDVPNNFISTIVSELLALGELATPAERIEVHSIDPGDNRILECAIECGADHVITGDRHLLDLGRYREIEIVTVSEFLSRKV